MALIDPVNHFEIKADLYQYIHHYNFFFQFGFNGQLRIGQSKLLKI